MMDMVTLPRKMIKYHFERGENPSLLKKQTGSIPKKYKKYKLVRLPQYNQTKRQFNGGDGDSAEKND